MLDTQSNFTLAGRVLLPNAERARYLRVIIKVMTYILLFRGFMYVFLLAKGVGSSISYRNFTEIQLIDFVLTTLPSLFLIVLFLMWLARAYRNLHRAGLPNLLFAPGWAIGAWFVPFMNFFRPYYIVKETWIRTQTAFHEHEKDAIPDDHSTIRYWWLIYILPQCLLGFIGGFVVRVNPGAVVEMTFVNGLLGSFFQVIALFLLGSLVKSLSAMETEFADRFVIAQANEVHRTAEQYRIETSLAAPRHDTGQQQPAIEAESKILRGEFVESKGLANTLIVCVCVLLLTTITAGLSEFAGTQNLAGNRFGFLLAVSFFTGTVACITFIVWLNRSYHNLRNLHIEKLLISLQLQQYWWLIPVGNIFYAWNMMRDIKKHSQLALTSDEEEPEPLPLLDWMLFSFLLAMLFVWIVSQLTDGNDYAGRNAGLAMILNVCSYLLIIFGWISAIIVIHKINRFQAELFMRVEKAVEKDTSVEYLKTTQ